MGGWVASLHGDILSEETCEPATLITFPQTHLFVVNRMIKSGLQGTSNFSVLYTQDLMPVYRQVAVKISCENGGGVTFS